MKPIDQPHGLCSVDPISLTGLAVAGLAGGAGSAISSLFGGGGGGSTQVAPTAPPPAAAAPPVGQPEGQKNGGGPAAFDGSPQSTFLGIGATPPTQSGQKSLLGQ